MTHNKGLAVVLVLVSVILAVIPTVDARNCLDCDPSIEDTLHGFTHTMETDTPTLSMATGTEGQICVNLVKACFADE